MVDCQASGDIRERGRIAASRQPTRRRVGEVAGPDAATLVVSAASLASVAIGALDAFQRILNCPTYPVVGMVA